MADFIKVNPQEFTWAFVLNGKESRKNLRHNEWSQFDKQQTDTDIELDSIDSIGHVCHYDVRHRNVIIVIKFTGSGHSVKFPASCTWKRQ